MGRENNGKNKEFENSKIKKNEVRNPNGRPKSFLTKFRDEWTKRLLDEYGTAPTKKDINDILLMLINVPEVELVEIANNKESAPVYMKIIATALLSDRSFSSLDIIFDRIYGKPAQQQPDSSSSNETTVKLDRNDNNEPSIA